MPPRTDIAPPVRDAPISSGDSLLIWELFEWPKLGLHLVTV
ncbi:hypothetical protein SAMN05444171_7709 [Bradyrhizobium lablabi]|uniref:Uncharacterized protein n=2 Tax=Bradyrhizobium TaxID=374 RepID=A0ABY0QFH2_9BRAD|nr:hypothetical protein SAMN05444163_7423 [Bradyrhizobium ottawaense]SEE49027.1 hypothetical protein SAMN05444171_7709 [Bradyrhizobium lablabi]